MNFALTGPARPSAEVGTIQTGSEASNNVQYLVGIVFPTYLLPHGGHPLEDDPSLNWLNSLLAQKNLRPIDDQRVVRHLRV